MKSNSFYRQNHVFINSAIIAAYTSGEENFFRQKDVKFYLELFINWQESIFSAKEEIQNVQIKRYLQYLIEEGLLNLKRRKNSPHYTLNRFGLIELIRQISENEDFHSPEEIYFSVYFIYNYRDNLISLVKKRGNSFPPGLKIEIETLLNSKNILTKQIEELEKLIKKIKQRLIDNQNARKKVEKLLSKGKGLNEIINIVEKEHPYQLNNQKRLSKLFKEIPDNLIIPELTFNSTNRGNIIWSSQLESYRTLLKTLKNLYV